MVENGYFSNEEYFKPLIDWKLINTLQDITTKYSDEGYEVVIGIKLMIPRETKVYFSRYNPYDQYFHSEYIYYYIQNNRYLKEDLHYEKFIEFGDYDACRLMNNINNAIPRIYDSKFLLEYLVAVTKPHPHSEVYTRTGVDRVYEGKGLPNGELNNIADRILLKHKNVRQSSSYIEFIKLVHSVDLPTIQCKP